MYWASVRAVEEMQKRSWLRWEEDAGYGGEGAYMDENGPAVADDVDGVLCAEEESAVIVMVRVLVKEDESIGACARKHCEKKRMGTLLVTSDAREEMSKAFVRREPTCGSCEAMQAAPLMALNASTY